MATSSRTRLIVQKAKVYMAGKIAPEDWRHQLVGDKLRNESVDPISPAVRDLDVGDFIYTGPFFVSDDHCGFHGPHSHGALTNDEWSDFQRTSLLEQLVVKRALAGIAACDLVFAYIENNTAFGTLFELGFAASLGKRIAMYFSPKVDVRDYWFLLNATGAAFEQERFNVDDVEMLKGCLRLELQDSLEERAEQAKRDLQYVMQVAELERQRLEQRAKVAELRLKSARGQSL